MTAPIPPEHQALVNHIEPCPSPQERLATAIILDAIVNIQKNNKYANDSKIFLEQLSPDNLWAEILGLDPSVLNQGLRTRGLIE